MIPRRPEEGPFHQRLKCRANTPDEQVAAFLANKEMVKCPHYNNCLISTEACRIRKGEAEEKAKESNGLNIYAKCLECKGVEAMDPKKCHVDGCGKKVLAKGMCSSHYWKEHAKQKKAESAPAVRPASPAPPAPPDPPAEMTTEITETIITVKPEILAAREKILAKRNPAPAPKTNNHKSVNVQFTGPDVALWEQLRDRAKRNRRDIRTEALVMIELMMSIEEGRP